jgi:hypothetical protein
VEVIPPSPDLMTILSMAWMVPGKVPAHPSLIPPKANMVWGSPLLEFVLIKVWELIKRGVNCPHNFKEYHLQSV